MNDMTTTQLLSDKVESQIEHRSGGRVRQVCVQVDADKVVIYGEASTYYAMQLATAAVVDLFPDHEIINAIEVI
jgi:hypothetical protein